ncbi:AcrB/AcrD/AcrF family protein [Sphingomonas pseudosanguinis]|uniref:AcrB/AcrD/AcrF family protein n=1 Tax=Sphingomonas pseudosanguinis TaxID=413712 RepID=UPI00161BB247|nr:AcrB/AcrD/AcrF family protein [Sphingomonas pseudosanguinis]MBN3538435.1 AcrB/AcrD/AcrF family protein [Sphingomonas pseudosanguinis]
MREASLERLQDEIDRNWRQWVMIVWLAVTGWYLYDRWGQIRWWSLGDTDDNIRLMQVRAWLDGQGWYDLRQYRLNPPGGFDIHWSRIVDLPIAGLILFFRLFTTPAWAERIACGLAPLLPLSVVMLALSATLRRLVSPFAWPVGLGLLLCANATMLMYMPMRIDHHGWQLAMLAVTVAGLCDPHARRGGALVGLASAVSLAIGLEMLPYAAMAGAILTLRWVWDRAEAPRLAVYALTLGGGSAAGFAAFASNANYAMRCDALTPVWLSVTVVAGALLFVMARVNPASRAARLGLAVVAGGIIAGGFASLFPQCLTRPEQVSPELQRNWLNNVREAKPIYKHPLRVALPMAIMPFFGMIGAIAAAIRYRTMGWTAIALFTGFACAMLLWQVRAAPAGQMLAVPGIAALLWMALPWINRLRSPLLRVPVMVAAVLLPTGIVAGLILKKLPAAQANAYAQRVNRATGQCVRTSVLTRVNAYPKATVFTFVDLGPRLIVTTHHNAIAGPYHRNGDAILDVQHAFQGNEVRARAIMKRHGATLLLICPDMAESTNYRARAPGGFYDRMAHGWVPDWLTPLPLPKGSPLRLYRVS